MSAPGSARGPRSDVLKTRWNEYERYRSNLISAGCREESLGKLLEEGCDLDELGRAVDELQSRWGDLCCRSRLLTRQVCGKDDRVMEGGHDDSSAAVRALLASVWYDPETLAQDDLERLCGRLGKDETRPSLDQLRSTPPEAYLCVGSWDQRGGQDVVAVLWPEQVNDEKELAELLAGDFDADKFEKLWGELGKNNCRLVRHRPTQTVYRVAHACNVLLSRQEWIDSKDSRQDQVVLELYDLNEKDEFKRKGQPPSAQLPSDTPVSGHDDTIHQSARECLHKKLGVEAAIVEQSARWRKLSVHARWHTSPTYPTLKTLYFIHMVRVSLEGLPESALFQTADAETSGRLHYWQWCPHDLVPTVAIMEEDRKATVRAHHSEDFVALEDWEPANPDLKPDVREQSKAALRALVRRDGWDHVRVKSMHGGKSGSLVVQLKGQDENGQPKTPAIAKIDDGADAVLKKEWESHTMMRDTLGKDHVPEVSEVVTVGEEGSASRRAAMAMELAGAAWFNADLNPHCHIVELADLYKHERDTHQGGMLVSGSLAEVTVGSVVDEVFGRIMRPREAKTQEISLLELGLGP